MHQPRRAAAVGWVGQPGATTAWRRRRRCLEDARCCVAGPHSRSAGPPVPWQFKAEAVDYYQNPQADTEPSGSHACIAHRPKGAGTACMGAAAKNWLTKALAETSMPFVSSFPSLPLSPRSFKAPHALEWDSAPVLRACETRRTACKLKASVLRTMRRRATHCERQRRRGALG